MEKIIIDEPILYRIQCKGCSSFLSNPFEYDYDLSKKDEHIKIDRYKGDNINYHSENEVNKSNNILYSYIFCLSCGQKVGYWISQASKKEQNNINKLFFFPIRINMVKYDKSQVSEEQDRIFKQEEIFYNSEFLTDEVFQYAKEHIDNFIKNVEIFEKERKEAEYCYRSFDRRISAIKNFFIRNVKDKDNAYHLGIDFSKEENPNKKKRNKTWNKKDSDKEDIKEEENNKSNGKINLNVIHDDKEEETKINAKNNKNKDEIKSKISDDRSGSDIYIEDKSKNNRDSSNKTKNNNKEPRNKSKNNYNKKNKNKRKRK